jgi:hypothetical protein
VSMFKKGISNRTVSYAVAEKEGGYLAVSVHPIAAGRWRVEGWHRGSQKTIPAGQVREINRAGDSVAWLVPEDDVSCVMTPLPRLGRREMIKAVSGWVARKEGGRPADWVASWRKIEEEQAADGRQQVYLAYAAHGVVARETTRAKALGVAPGWMLPPSLVLDQLFRRAVEDHDTLKVWSIVFVGEHSSILCVSNRRCMLLSRILPRDPAAEVSDSEYLQRLATEVDRSAFFARQTEGVSGLDRIVVCGDPQLARRFVDELVETAELPALHWPLTDVIDPDGHHPSADEQILLAAAVLAGEGADYNLAAARDHGLLGARARRRLVFAAATAAAALVPLLTVGALITSRVQQQYLDDARGRIDTAIELAEGAAAVYERQKILSARVQHIDHFVMGRPDLPAVLLSLASVTPPQVRYRDLQVIERRDRTLLHLTAESTASTVTEAQRAFMAFHCALDTSAFLRPIGEPRQLQITERTEAGLAGKAVLFSLDYELVAEDAAREGS